MKRFLVVLGGISWLTQVFVLPAFPAGVWPNVATIGMLGLPPFLLVHGFLSLLVVAGLFALSSIYLARPEQTND